MKPCERIGCESFPCLHVRHEYYIVPDVEIRTEDVWIVLIAEASPPAPADCYYAPGPRSSLRPRSRRCRTPVRPSTRSRRS